MKPASDSSPLLTTPPIQEPCPGGWIASGRVATSGRRRGVKRRGIRRAILETSHYRCSYCGCSLDLVTVTIDHAQPISRGGRSELANYRAACKDCNTRKGSQTEDEFLRTKERKPHAPLRPDSGL